MAVVIQRGGDVSLGQGDIKKYIKTDPALPTTIADTTDDLKETFAEHKADTVIHVTAADKARWDSKAEGIEGMGTTQLGGIEPSICKDLEIKVNGAEVRLTWEDSGDTVVDNHILCSWAGTKLVKKLGSYPESPDDGILLVDNTELYKYITTPYVDTIVAEEDWKYRLFPYSQHGVYSLNDENKFGLGYVYEFVFRNGESRPGSIIRYAGRNENYTPAHMDYTNDLWDWGSWKHTWLNHISRPCLLNHNGKVDCYLDPYNVTHRVDGTTEPRVTDPAYDGEVMVEFDQVWIKEEIIDGDFHISLSNKQLPGFDCYSHTNAAGKVLDHIYVSKYQNTIIEEKARSFSGQQGTGRISGITMQSYCRALGTGWDIHEYSFWRMMKYLCMLISRSTDSQTAFGKMCATNYNGSLPGCLNGQNDYKGPFYGKNQGSGLATVSVFNIEMLYGYLASLVNGCYASSTEYAVKMVPPYDAVIDNPTDLTAMGYKIIPGVTVPGPGWQSAMTLVPGYGIFPSETKGSATTYYPDGFNCSGGFMTARFGGCCAAENPNESGMFTFWAHYNASGSEWDFGIRNTYKSPT